ncbi:MAG: SpoIIE family protein phosphatase [Cytophagales bacterium]|nr:SpoIIE family protein phosphatase [Bernardetiaceae bacterium]MDW8211588.1 SpoIIE family protein phosphatase [Cytophagales bacterium]
MNRLQSAGQWLVLYLLSQLFCYGQSYERGAPFINNYLPQFYKAGLANWAIAQDLRGVLYFGNDDGVLEYDGNKWQLIRTGSVVRALACDDKGRIYVGGSKNFGYLRADSLGRMRYEPLHTLLPEDKRNFSDVWTVHCLPEGVFFQTDETIYILKENKGKPYLQVVPATTFFTFGYAVRNQFYVQQNDYGLMKWTGSALTPVKGTESFSASLISQVLPWGEKELLICVQNIGFFILGQDKITRWTTEADELLRDFRSYTARWVGQGNYRAIAIGMLGVGIILISPQGKLLGIYNRRNGLADDFALCIAEDNQNGLWVGLYNGIARLEYPSELTVFNEYHHQVKGVVNDITRHQGTIYIATISGLFRLVPRELTHHAAKQKFYDAEFEPVPGFKLDCWALLSIDSDLLVGTFMGVKLLRNETATNIISEETPPNIFCLTRSAIDPDRVFAGSAYSIRCLYRKEGNWIDAGRLEGVRDDIRHLCEDKDGNLWAASLNNGIYLISFLQNNTYQFTLQPQVRQLGIADGLPSLTDNHLFTLNGQIRLATEKGIYKYEGGKFVPDSAFHQPYNKQQRKVILPALDRQGNLWALSFYKKKIEIGYWQKTDSGWTYHQSSLQRLHDLHAVQTLYTQDTAAIWLSDLNGIYRYQPSQRIPSQFTFKVLIRQVSIGQQDSVIFYGAFADKEGRATSQQSTLFSPDLPYSLNRIRFVFSATAFNSTQAMQFQYKLEGLEKKWSDWTADNDKEYTNLAEGHYVFRLRARDVFGNISQEASYHFVIKSPWYRTVVAYVFYILLAILIIWLIGEWRLRLMKREKERLSQQIALRTRELSQANAELESTLAQVKKQNEIIQQKSLELEQANEQLFELNGALSRTLAQVQWQNKEIERQRDKIRQQQEETASSIRYARRIQDAMLPDASALRRFFAGYFILNRPRDIVSGDFYWLAEKDGKAIVVVADCTGHGVPGAMMSMLGISLLDNIVARLTQIDPAVILNEMNQHIRGTLQQEKGTNSDGMDMSLIVYDAQTQTIQFAGAHNPLYLVREGTLMEYKADRLSVGGFQREGHLFTTQEIAVQKGDVLYMFSDGYADQISSQTKQKLTVKRFRQLCIEISNLPIEEQERAFAKHLAQWQGEEEQIDDILLMGLKI